MDFWRSIGWYDRLLEKSFLVLYRSSFYQDKQSYLPILIKRDMSKKPIATFHTTDALLNEVLLFRNLHLLFLVQ